MSEIKERPDSCGLWEREEGGRLHLVLEDTDGQLYCENGLGPRHMKRGRYRLRTLDPLPWPAEQAAPDPTNFGDEIRRRLDADPALRERVDYEAIIAQLEANVKRWIEVANGRKAKIIQLEADVRRWMEVSLTQQPKIVRLEAEIDELKGALHKIECACEAEEAARAKLRADVAAWSKEAQECNVGHGWSGTDPIWLAVPMPQFEKLDAIVEEQHRE